MTKIPAPKICPTCKGFAYECLCVPSGSAGEPTPTGRVDDRQPGANMYGVVPCPKCQRHYRYPTACSGSPRIFCDDCGFVEPIANPEVLRG